MANLTVAGKVALVTGAARGIGFETARLLHEREAIVNGLERRAPRIVAPGWSRVLSVLRGLLNPMMDARLERDPNAHDLVRRAEADDPASKRGQLAEECTSADKPPISSGPWQ